jgi:hypothetical protein
LRLPFTVKASPSQAIVSIVLTPPGAFRNCAGGFTWNGRTASTRVSVSGRSVGLWTS